MYMKLAATKVFASYINKVAKKKNIKAKAVFQKVGFHELNQDAVFDADNYGDVDYSNNTVKVIKILYPDEYYACPQIITTSSINNEAKRRKVKTPEALEELIADLIEI